MLIAALSVALALAQSSAPTATAASEVAPAAAAAAAKPEKPKKPKVICTEEEQMGSVMKKRVCRTAETIEADRKAAERQLQSCQGPNC